MKLRTRLLLESGILLLIALVGNYVLVALLGYRAMREQAMERASALAAVLNAVGEQGLRVEAAADRLLGEQMVVQAYLAAHLVDLAENYAHLSAAEIKTRLKDVADHTVLDEFWITDEKGHAYLRNVEDIDFTFPSEPTERNQAWRFSGLLGEDHGQLAQAAMRREYDGRTFKYAAVSGIDRPRIVQVGYDAESLSRLVAGMRAADLARATRGAGRIERICAVGAGGELYMDTELPGQPEQGQRVRDEKLLATVAKAQQERVPVVQTAGDYLTVASPARAPDGSPYTLLTTFNAAPMLVRMRRTLWSLVFVSGAAVLVGLALAWRGSASIARPLEALALEAAQVGKGDLDRVMDVKASGEVAALAEAFGRMTKALKQHIEELRRTTAAKEQLEAEIRVAAKVQTWMLPRELPAVPGVELFAATVPAREVGGDFYDFVVHRRGRLGLVVGDASGKGLPGALFAAQSLSVLRALALRSQTVCEVVSGANSVLLVSGEAGGMFATAFYGVYDPGGHVLRYVNAGHCTPVLVRNDGRPEPLALQNSLPLGLIEGYEAAEEQVSLRPGDTLVFYSDGITDARDPEGSLFGLERLLQCLCGCQSLGPQQTVAHVLQAVQDFAGSAEPADDMTVLAIRATA